MKKLIVILTGCLIVCVAQATLITDDFNRIDTAPSNLGSNWTVTAGLTGQAHFKISGDTAFNTDYVNQNNTGKDTAYLNTLGTLNTDGKRFTISCDIKLDNTGNSNFTGLMFNYQDPLNYYILRYNGLGTSVGLAHVIDGVVGTFGGTAQSFTHDVSKFYTLTVSSTAAYTFDWSLKNDLGTVLCSATGATDNTSSFTDGFGGIFSANSFDNTYDNFSLEVIPEPVTLGLFGLSSIIITAFHRIFRC